MIDKWFREDIDSILKEKNRIVVVAEDENAWFLHNFIPSKYKVYKTANEIEELKIKYEIEKKCADKKVVIFTSTSRDKLKFIREYCETCGCIDVKYLHNYVKEKVYNKLGLNLQLASDEIATAAKISVGKPTDYWLDIVHKGSDRLFDIGYEILPFLNDPGVYCKKLDKQVKKEFFARLNKWLGRDNIEQPPVTLAKETAEKILGSLAIEDGKKKFKDVYKKWADSKKYEDSLGRYIAETQLSYDDNIWAVDVSHPFTDIDRKWLLDISKNLSDKEFIKNKLNKIKQRAADKTGKKLCERLYSEFLNEKEIIQPFQEYYNDILIQFLDKWYINYGGYQENQTGFIEGIIDNSQEKCAIIVGDGISYEISRIVSEKLKSKYKTDCSFKLADFPSTTENNMSRLYISSGEIEPFQKKRVDFLKNKYKEAIRFMRLDEVSYSTESNQYLICTYKDIDDIGEKMQQNALKFIWAQILSSPIVNFHSKKYVLK